MNTPNSQAWTLRFSLFGIPVRIRPIAWVVLAILGGAFGVDDGGDLGRVLVFVAVAMLVLLVHEFGHALTGRATGAVVEEIEVAGMGASTNFVMLPPARWSFALVLLAGPLASLLLGALLGVLFGLQIGNAWVGLRVAFEMPWASTLSLDVQQQLMMGLYLHPMSEWLLAFYTTGMLVCFWWSLFNLLPIFPLDGGKLLGTLLNNYKLPCVLGLLICAGLGIWNVLEARWLNVMILGYLGYINWQYLRVFRRAR